jgi:hypothetical protein
MEENEKEQFACPSCGTIVDEDAKECLICGAIFENGEDSHLVPGSEINQDQGPSESWTQFPPQPEQMQKPGEPSQGIPENIPPPPNPEEDMSSIPLTDEGHKPEKTPLSVSEFSGSGFNKEGQEEGPPQVENEDHIQELSQDQEQEELEQSQVPVKEEEQEIFQDPQQDDEQELPQVPAQDEEQDPSQIPEQDEEQDLSKVPPQDEEQDLSQVPGQEKEQEPSQVPVQEEEQDPSQVPKQEEEQVSDLPVSLQGLHRYKDYGSSIEKEMDQEKKIIGALKDYSKSRKKRYTMGTLFLGLGVVLFVLLWLVVVYDVLVTETQQWFGAHIVLILVAAGIFFTCGLFMILTYPKSSLIEILAYISESKEKGRSTEN